MAVSRLAEAVTLDRLSRYPAAGVTTLNVSPFGSDRDGRLAIVRTMAELKDELGL